MFERLKAKWKVNGIQLFLILCTFAVTGTLTAYISRSITSWVGFNEETFWLWKTLLRIAVLIFGYQVLILAVSFFFGQFPFFWNYEKKILRWMFGRKASYKQGSLSKDSLKQLAGDRSPT
jgi:ABC-type multidrug transport system permease subunit